MIIKRKKIMLRIVGYLIVLSAFMLFVLYLLVDYIQHDSLTVIATFILIGMISGYSLCKSNYYDSISFRVMFWFFNLIFFFIVPLAQYLTDNWIYPLTKSSIIIANFFILFYLGFFCMAYTKGQAWANRNIKRIIYRSNVGRPQPLKNQVKISPVRLFIFVILSCTIAIAFIASVGFSLTSSIIGEAIGGWGPRRLIGQFYLQPLIFFVFLFFVFRFKISSKRKAVDYFMLIFAIAPAIAMNSPLASARFYVFAIYLGLVIILYPPNARNRSVYLFLLFMGIFGSHLVIAFQQNVLFQDGAKFPWLSKAYFYSGHFDAYENFVHSINYVGERGIVWGKQILGVIFFWVPREFWPDKPIGTGSFIASTYLYASFTNVGCPLIEEAYVNFFIPGIIVMSGLIGMLSGYLDTKYKAHLSWVQQRKFLRCDGYISKIDSRYMVLYPVLIGLSLFMMRGDMMSSFAFSCGIVAAYCTVSFLITQPS